VTTRQRAGRGFTLVEVLVALVILAVLSGMAFRGIDAIVHAKERALADTDRTLRLNNGMAQFEYDASQMVNTQVVDPIGFDGATLRLTRRTPDGLQLVLWTLQDHRWQRWASPPMTHVPQLQEAWLRSQQWETISGSAVTVLDKVDAFQVYTYCLGGGWGNVQSTCGGGGGGDPSSAPPPPPPPSGDGPRTLCPNPRPRAAPPSHARPKERNPHLLSAAGIKKRSAIPRLSSRAAFAGTERNGRRARETRTGNERKKRTPPGRPVLAFVRGNLRPSKQAEVAGAGKLAR